MSEFDTLLSAAIQLPVDERLRLIDELAATVPDDRPPALSAEWLAEIQRRCDELDAGVVTPVPWKEVRADLMRKVGIERAN